MTVWSVITFLKQPKHYLSTPWCTQVTWFDWKHHWHHRPELVAHTGTGRSAPESIRPGSIRPTSAPNAVDPPQLLERSAPSFGSFRPNTHKPKYTLIRTNYPQSPSPATCQYSVWHSNFNTPTWFPPFPFYCLYLALSTLVELLHVWRSSSSAPHFYSVRNYAYTWPSACPRVTMPYSGKCFESDIC